RDRVALRLPPLLLVLRAVVRAVDVADVVAVVAVGEAVQERRPVARARPRDRARRGGVHLDDVLAVDVLRGDPERPRPVGDRTSRHLAGRGVLVVAVVLADRDAVGAERLRREPRAGRDARGAADDRVRAEVAVRMVGDVHRAALAAAIALLLAEQLAVHATHVGALRDAVAVAAVRGGNRVVLPQCGADADRDRLFADVQVRQPGHLRGEV